MVFGAIFQSISDAIKQLVIDVNTDIPYDELARDSSYQEFTAFMRKQGNNPSYTNMYSVHFSTPSMFGSEPGWALSTNDEALLLDYYCDSINLPSKQISTGSLVTIGAPMKYATGTNFSQVSMTFKMPANHKTRTIFERWMAFMRNDGDQYVDFYDNYVAPTVRIFKWERGGGSIVRIQDVDQVANAVLKCGVGQPAFSQVKRNRVVAMWELRNVFPFNMGSIQLNNQESRIATMTVGFYFERYRYFVNQYDDWGAHDSHLPGDPQHDPRKASNRSINDARSNWITYNF